MDNFVEIDLPVFSNVGRFPPTQGAINKLQ